MFPVELAFHLGTTVDPGLFADRDDDLAVQHAERGR